MIVMSGGGQALFGGGATLDGGLSLSLSLSFGVCLFSLLVIKQNSKKKVSQSQRSTREGKNRRR